MVIPSNVFLRRFVFFPLTSTIQQYQTECMKRVFTSSSFYSRIIQNNALEISLYHLTFITNNVINVNEELVECIENVHRPTSAFACPARLLLNLHNIVKAVLALTPHRRVHNQIIDYENIVIYI